jgi:terminase large subunit-like protein
MKLNQKDVEEKYVNIFTTKKVDELIERDNLGGKIHLHEKIWFKNEVNVRKARVKFAPTKKELDEYTKCKLNIHYFANKYCKIKLEDGTIGQMTLRDYQKDILDLYYNNNYSILMASRQTGKTISAAIAILHFCTFNKDKGAMIVANKGATVIEIVDKIKGIYKHLPFFLKKGIVNWNQSSIVFDNGCRIKTDKRTKEPAIGFTIDFLYIDEFAHIPNNIIEQYYTAVVPIVSSVDNPKIIITSTPKGINLFHRMLIGAELPEYDPNWNGFKALRIYWWQMEGRRDSKIFLNEILLKKYNIKPREIKKFLVENGYEIYDKIENNRKAIFIKHYKDDEKTITDHIKTLRYNSLPISELGLITNWEEQQTKIIGGEDNFKQEYDLHFLSGGKMLFDNVTIESMAENKYDFSYYDIPAFNKNLKIPYNSLTFVKNQPSLFNFEEAKAYSIFVSVDLSEGLGDDYSVINIFRLIPKTEDEIKMYKKKLSDKYDYFKLEQIGVFKSNIYSVKEVAHILYLIVFELFNDDLVKIALERNTYGDELLAHMPHVFNDNNNYSNHVFLRYKHRIEQSTTKMGLKITSNKKLLVKDYQTNTKKGNIIIHDQYTINEVSTFIKHETPSGGITYKAESGHDDCIMTCVVMSSVFNMTSYRDAVDNLINVLDPSILDGLKEYLSEYDNDTPDLTSVIGGYKQIYNKSNNKPSPFGSNPYSNNPYSNKSNMGGFNNKPRFAR